MANSIKQDCSYVGYLCTSVRLDYSDKDLIKNPTDWRHLTAHEQQVHHNNNITGNKTD